MLVTRRYGIAALLVAIALQIFSGCGGNDDVNIVSGLQGTPTVAVVDTPDGPVEVALLFEEQPSVGVVGEPFAVTVALTRNGVPVQGLSVPVQLSLNSSTATLGGTTSLTTVNGVAGFTDLTIDQPGDFILVASAADVAQVQSAVIEIRAVLLLGSAVGPFGGNMARAALVQINPTDGSYLGSRGIIGDGSRFAQVQDIECVSGNRLLGAALDKENPNVSYLVEIDVESPNDSTIIGEITSVAAGGHRIAALAYDADNDTLYAMGHRNFGNNPTLYTVDMQTGAGTAFPNELSFGNRLFALAFDPTDTTLYYVAFEGGDSVLGTVDKQTGVATPIGPLNNDREPNALTFEPGTGSLLAAERVNATVDMDTGYFGTLNTSSASFTERGFTDPAFLTGLAFCPAPGVLPRRPVNYTVSNPSFVFDDISSTGTALGLDNDSTSVQTIGFPLDFNGRTFSELTISTNGSVAFGPIGAWSWENLRLPEPAVGEMLVFWDILNVESNPDITREIFVETLGTAPNRRFIVQWDNITAQAGIVLGAGTFQLALFESSGIIEYRYLDVELGDPEHDFGASATIGLQDLNDAITISVQGAPSLLTNQSTIRFTPAP